MRQPLSLHLARSWLAGWFVIAAAFALTSSAHDLSFALQAPSFTHPLGFDAFGRDVLKTVLRASITSAAFAIFAVIFSTTAATLLGSAIALAPERLRFACLRVLDAALAFPSLLFALAWAAVRGPGWDTLIFALVIGTLPGLTRLLYARTREVMIEEYVLASRSLGATSWTVARNHLFPALLALSRVKFPNLFAHALLAEATLSFLGIGAPIGRDTWGSLLAQGKEYLFESPHIAIGSGLPLFLCVLALQLMSESSEKRR